MSHPDSAPLIVDDAAEPDIAGLRNLQLATQSLWEDLTGASFTVVGLGKSGVAAANALVERGALVLVVDDAPESKLTAQLSQLDRRVQVSCGGGPAGRRGDLFVVSPGIMPHSRRFADVKALACAILSEIELFYRLDRASVGGLGHPLVAISGTDGKTTTTLWTAHLLRKAGFEVVVGGNIGDPLCGFLGHLGDNAIVVAEVSAFQLYTCSLTRPRAAVVTNIALDHMDWFQNDLAAYVRTKCKVGDQMGPGDTLLINGDDAELLGVRQQLAEGAPHAWQPFSIHSVPPRGLGFDGEMLWWSLSADSRVPLIRADELGCQGAFPITGVHNVENALGAAGLAIALGAPIEVIRQGLRDFSLPSHRIEPVGTIGEVRFIDDSKATNPHAAIAGLRALQPQDGGKLIWIAGGSEKDADFGELGDIAGQIASAAILIGQTADRIAACLPPSLPVHRAATLQECIPLALQLASPRGVVLLSPACASYDMFKSYAHRGDVFRESVQAFAKVMAGRNP